jgi:pyruvate,water dikinase
VDEGSNQEEAMVVMNEDVVWLGDVGRADVAVVGGKNASLGELIGSLLTEGVAVPDGFALTASAYRRYVSANGLETKMAGILMERESGNLTWRQAGSAIRGLVLAGEFPAEITDRIRRFYRDLAGRTGEADPAVAVRSSATAEDLPEASFAGQQESFLNVRGEPALLDACRRAYASLFTDRAISYRDIMGFGQLDVALSVGVQLMVRSDAGASGVMFSLDPETGFPRAAVISANWGLGETVVQGSVNPDRYCVFKPLLADLECSPIIEKIRGSKLRKLVYARGGGTGTLMVDTTEVERGSFVLDDADIVQLGRWAVRIEKH